jgi:cytochrome c peroxidase
MLAPNEAHRYTMLGRKGGVIRAACNALVSGEPDTLLALIKPGASPVVLAADDNSGGHRNALIEDFELPADGRFELLTSSYDGATGGAYVLSLRCLKGPCAAEEAPSGVSDYGRTRIEQADIDAGRYAPNDLFTIGDILFDHVFAPREGLGNGLAAEGGGRDQTRGPRLRMVQHGAFGGPDATSCARCHSVGGPDGAGDPATNTYQDGDGENPASALSRNAPAAIGLGYLERLGEEMSAELQREVAVTRAGVRKDGRPVRISLSSKGVRFGSVGVLPGGGLDAIDLVGVDADLVVKPFGWKGRVALLRRFVEDALRTHLGIQPDSLIAQHCATPHPDTMGDGPDCTDPDRDGVRRELTEGQLTAMSVYMAMQEAPIRMLPRDAASQTRAARGEQAFREVGCASCHVPTLQLDDPRRIERPDSAAAKPFAIDLTVDVRPPRLLRGKDGRVAVELFSDLKRHNLGPALADPRRASSTPQIPAGEWLTRPLWGVAVTAPYLHDGRAATLADAILAHGGEAETSRARYKTLSPSAQRDLVEFLKCLGRERRPHVF